MSLHKIPTIKIKLENVNPTTGIGYIYLKAHIPNTKRYVPKSLGHKVPAKNWDKVNEIATVGYMDSKRINSLITHDRALLQAQFDEHYKKGAIFDEVLIRSIMFPEAASKDFIKLFKDYSEYIKSKWSSAYHRSFETAMNTFIGFAGDTLPFSMIDTEYLQQYEMYLRKKTIKNKLGKVGLEGTTIHNRMTKVGEVLKVAIDRKYLDADRVKGFKIPAYIDPETDYLTSEQVNKIWELISNGSFDYDAELHLVACFFMVECCGGIRFSDWSLFKVETLVRGRNFKVRTTKTKSAVYLDLDVFKSLDRILQYIASKDLVFDLDSIKTNKKLKIVGGMIKCGFDLTTHVGRHTFGTILGELNYTTRFIAEAMGISERTAKRYIKITGQSMNNEMALRGGF